jgi:hypothetical protein
MVVPAEFYTIHYALGDSINQVLVVLVSHLKGRTQTGDV